MYMLFLNKYLLLSAIYTKFKTWWIKRGISFAWKGNVLERSSENKNELNVSRMSSEIKILLS